MRQVTVLNVAFGLFAYVQYGGPDGRVCDSSFNNRTGSGLGCVKVRAVRAYNARLCVRARLCVHARLRSRESVRVCLCVGSIG